MTSLVREFVRQVVHRYVPANFHHPVGLAGRLVRSKSPEAWFAMWTAGLGFAAIPLDLLLRRFETRMYEAAADPQRPVILVAGAPRSGTTIVSQVLIRHLPVAYLNNLTAVFPRSPLAANRLFGFRPRNEDVGTTSYYAKTTGLWAPNDALQIWDRWLGADRHSVPRDLDPGDAERMRRFFGAAEALFSRPILNKTNLLNVVAHRVAEAMPTAQFILLVRNPLYLAQSLLIARRKIHGDPSVAYGIAPPDDRESEECDPVEEVCRQALYHNQVARRQQAVIGSERCRIVRYETFCHNPAVLVHDVAQRIPGCTIRDDSLPEPLEPSKQRKVTRSEFRHLQETLRRLQESDRAHRTV